MKKISCLICGKYREFKNIIMLVVHFLKKDQFFQLFSGNIRIKMKSI